MSVVTNDTIWKDIIEEFFVDFMNFFAPALSKQIDFDRGYEFLDKELNKINLESEGKNRRCDKLVKVFLKDGTETWILIHVEIQGYKDEYFSDRAFETYYRLWDKFKRDIYALAVFTDKYEDYKPDKYERRFYGTNVLYAYNTYKVLEQDEATLIESNNPFASVVLAALYTIKSKDDDDKKIAFLIKLTDLLLDKKWDDYKIQRLFIFIDLLISIKNETKRQVVKERLTNIIKKGEKTEMLTLADTNMFKAAIELTRDEVTKEVTKEILLKQLKRKFKLFVLPDNIIKEIENSDEDKLNKITDKIFDMETIDEVLNYLR